MKQYFQENENLEAEEVQIRLERFGHEFIFFSRRGLFSHNEVDAKSLLLIENIPKIKGSLLDLGCGFGAIGIILTKINQSVDLVGCDINRIALSMAEKNAEINGVSAKYLHSDCFYGVSGFFDTIALNPPIHAGKEVMYKMFRQAKEHLAPNGAFYIVIQKKHGAESSLRYLRGVYRYCEPIYKKKGTYVIECMCEKLDTRHEIREKDFSSVIYPAKRHELKED